MNRYEKEITNLIYANDISVLVAPTGIGKTTQLPLLFAKYNAVVYCIQPTNYAVMNVYNYMRKNKSIGFMTDKITMVKKDNKIIYCTCDVVVKLLMEKKFDFCSIIMVDDSHYYSMDYELLLYLWLYFYTKTNLPKLFLSLSINDIPYIPIDISESNIVIKDEKEREIMYHDKNYKYSQTQKLIEDCADIIIELNKKRPIEKNEFSSWIIYLWDTKSKHSLLRLLKDNEDFDIMLFNKTKTLYNQRGKRLLLFVTDMNTSVTLNHVDGIIDCMLEVNSFKNLSGGNKNVLRNISKSTAIQRDGRTNRVKKGFTYRMCDDEFYSFLSKHSISEMDRVDLTQLFLKLYKYDLDPKEVFKSKLDSFTLNYYCDFIDTYELKTNKIFNLQLGLDAKHIIFISEWNKFKLPLFQGIVLAVLFNLKRPLFYYSDKNKKTYFNEHFNKFGTSILEIYCNALLHFLDEFKSLSYDELKFKSYCKENSFNYNEFKSMLDTLKSIKSKLTINNYSVVVEKFDVDTVLDTMIPIIKDVYKDNFCHKNGKNYINNERKVYSLNIYEHYSSSQPSDTIIMFNSSMVTDDENRNLGKKLITYYINL